MNSFIKFFHQLMHPHCPDCAQEFEDQMVCESCETLKLQLDIANKEKQDLLKAVLPQPVTVPVKTEDEPVKLKSPIPWAVRRQLLEQESVNRARALKEAELNKVIGQSIEDLEKEVGLEGTTGE